MRKSFVIKGSEGYLHLQKYADGIFRFTYTSEGILPASTPAVVLTGNTEADFIEESRLKLDDFTVDIDSNTLCISIYDKNNELFHRDTALDINKAAVEKQILWEKGFYGLGEKYGWINLKNTSTANWNTDVLGLNFPHSSSLSQYHTSVNFFIGVSENQCYGIYFDNSYKTSFDFGNNEDNLLKLGAEDGHLDYYLILGDTISEVVRGYTRLTGASALPPKAFLGYQQCRYSYESREELLEVARRMRKENIPCDILYLDIDYMKDYKVFTIDGERFGSFEAMAAELKEMGYKLVVIIDPGVKVEEGYDVYESGLEKDFYVKTADGEAYVGEVWPGPSAFPDFLRSDVREWWGSLHKDFVQKGIDGFWNDMNEPSDFSTKTKTLPVELVHTDDQGSPRLHKEIHNLYAMLEAEATFNGVNKLHPNKRPFILTRAAFAGTQRYAALWTGDNSSIWEHMEMSIPMILNLGLSGFAFTGADVGGFTDNCSGELLLRWTQLGAFLPLFRNHSNKGTINQEPWCFSMEYLDINKKYIALRYRFLTYIYNLMKQSSELGDPVVRPLFYHYQEDQKTFNINDQFLLGRDIMVCPVLRPGMDARMVYLPEGEWYDYWTGEKAPGGRYIVRETPLDILPLYIRAGAIIPMDIPKDFVQKRDEEIELHYYPGEKGKYTLYVDDGETYDYQKGEYHELQISIEKNGNVYNVETNMLKDGYAAPEIKLYIHDKEDLHLTINGVDKFIEHGKYLILK